MFLFFTVKYKKRFCIGLLSKNTPLKLNNDVLMHIAIGVFGDDNVWIILLHRISILTPIIKERTRTVFTQTLSFESLGEIIISICKECHANIQGHRHERNVIFCRIVECSKLLDSKIIKLP